MAEQLSFRLMAMIRGGLIGMIYHKLIRSPAAGITNGDSTVMTLIGADVERIATLWNLAISGLIPDAVQLGMAVWLLYRQIGVVCVAPVILALCKSIFLFLSTTNPYVAVACLTFASDNFDFFQNWFSCEHASKDLAECRTVPRGLYSTHYGQLENRQDAGFDRSS